jgi:hypothetical protein
MVKKPTKAAQTDSPAEFARVRSDAWEHTVDGWAWEPRDKETSFKSGSCPSCDHPITLLDSTATYSSFVNYEAANCNARRYVTCNCGFEHKGAPDGEIGCGANGLIFRD